MSQRERLEKRVKDILDKHIESQRYDSPDAPLLLRGGKDGGCMDCMGGIITDKTRAGQKAYLEFMRKKKSEGMKHADALMAWKEHKKLGSLPPPPKELLLEDREADKSAYIECMKLLGLPPPSADRSKEAEKMKEDLVKRLKGGAKRGVPLPVDHRKKLDDGRLKYMHFMKVMKSKGLSHKDALKLYKEMKCKKGGNWFDDFRKGFMLIPDAVSKLAPLAPLLL